MPVKGRLFLRLAEKKPCTDNAAMIGILAEQKLLNGQSSTPLDAKLPQNWRSGD